MRGQSRKQELRVGSKKIFYETLGQTLQVRGREVSSWVFLRAAESE
jgi:hypothetical protein